VRCLTTVLVLCIAVGLGLGSACSKDSHFEAFEPQIKSMVWVRGWNQPLDSQGDCRFDRLSERLTIAIPGTVHVLAVSEGHLNAPCLLRSITGNFSAQIRVGGVCPTVGKDTYKQAGLLVTDGTFFVKFLRVEGPEPNEVSTVATPPMCYEVSEIRGDSFTKYVRNPTPPLDMPVYLRLQRLGPTIALASSRNGKDWDLVEDSMGRLENLKLQQKVEVGLVAESTGPGEFNPWFENFKLNSQ